MGVGGTGGKEAQGKGMFPTFNFANLFYSTWKMNTNPWVFFVRGEGSGINKGVGVEARYEHHSGCLSSTSLPGERGGG